MTDLTSSLPTLEPKVFVPAAEVDEHIATVRLLLATLTAELASLEQAADAAENDLLVSPTAQCTAQAVSAVRGAIVDMRTAGEREIDAELVHAQACATARVAEAEAAAAAIRAAAGLTPREPAPAPLPLKPPAPAPMAVPRQVAPLPAPPAPAHHDIALTTVVPAVPASEAPAATPVKRDNALTRWPPASIPAEAVLPMLALVILLIVVLAWMG